MFIQLNYSNKYFIFVYIFLYLFYYLQNIFYRRNIMKSTLNSSLPKRISNSKYNCSYSNDKFPNLNKSSKTYDSLKSSFMSLSISGAKQTFYEKSSYLPQINDKQNQNPDNIRKLLKQKSVNVKLAPVHRQSKNKFGWVSKTCDGSFNNSSLNKNEQKLSNTIGESTVLSKDKKQQKNIQDKNEQMRDKKQLTKSSLYVNTTPKRSFIFRQQNKSRKLQKEEEILERIQENNQQIQRLKQQNNNQNEQNNQLESQRKQQNKTSKKGSIRKVELNTQQKNQFQETNFIFNLDQQVNQQYQLKKQQEEKNNQQNKQIKKAKKLFISSIKQLLNQNDNQKHHNQDQYNQKHHNQDSSQSNQQNKINSLFQQHKQLIAKTIKCINSKINYEYQSIVNIDTPSMEQISQYGSRFHTNHSKSRKYLKSMKNIKTNKNINLPTEQQLQDKPKSHWLQTLIQLNISFQNMDYSKAILPKQVWLHIIQQFNKFYMDKQQKFYFLQLIKQFVTVNFRKKLDDELTFCGQMGVKLQKLQNNIHFKHKECLKCWKFVTSQEIIQNATKISQTNQKDTQKVFFTKLKFDMKQEQVYGVAKYVQKLCAYNMDAFAYISLYFQKAINKMIHKQNKSFEYVQKQFNKILSFLEQKYPANKTQIQKQNKNTNQNVFMNTLSKQNQNVSIGLDLVGQSEQFANKVFYNYGIEAVSIDKSLFELVKFEKDTGKNNLSQLTQFIQRKAVFAKQDQHLFISLTKQPCKLNGYGYKTDVKIKPNSKSKQFSIYRTIQKLITSRFDQKLFKYSKQKRMKQADQKITKYIQEDKQINDQWSQIKKTQTNNKGISKFIQWEQKQVKKQLTFLLNSIDSIQFSAKDLLRGKCKFNTIEEIKSAIHGIKKQVEAKSNTKIIQISNRLGKNTKDVVLIFQLPNSIAEFQLALKQDTILNQFNHKIYQLKRSQIYACVTNLFILGKKWGQIYFKQQMELFNQMFNANPKQTFDQTLCSNDLKKDVYEFQKQFLKPFEIKYQNDQTQQFDLNKEIDYFINKIQEIIRGKYVYHINKALRQSMQDQNQIMFYLKNGQINKALQVAQKFTPQQLERNPIILRLKGDIYRQREFQGDQQRCVQCYQKYVSVQIGQKGQTMQLANVLLLLGQIKLGNRKYDIALKYFTRCLQIKAKICGKQSIQYAMVLNRIGHLHRIKTDFKAALYFYKLTKDIIVEKAGQDSLNAAQVYCSLGNAYYCLGQMEEAQHHYVRSLQLYKKIKGNKSLQVSILYNNMGNFYKQQMKYENALKYYNDCLQIKKKIKGKHSLDAAHVYNNIGALYKKMGLYQTAQKLYCLCLQIRKGIKNNSYIVSQSYLNLGKFYTQKSTSEFKGEKDYQKAMENLKNALALKKSIVGQQSTDIADVLFSIGSLYWTVKNGQKALSYYKCSLKIYEKLSSQHSSVQSTQILKICKNIASIHKDQAIEHKKRQELKQVIKNERSALKYYQKAMQIQLKKKAILDLAYTYYHGGKLCVNLQLFEKGFKYANKSYSIWKKMKNTNQELLKAVQVLKTYAYKKAEQLKAYQQKNGQKVEQREDGEEQKQNPLTQRQKLQNQMDNK